MRGTAHPGPPPVEPGGSVRARPSPPAPRLRIEIFDGFVVRIDDVVVDIPSAKARAMLVSLALSPAGEIARDILAERLWSRSPSAEHQRNSLKRDLKTLIDLFVAHGFDGLTGRRQSVHLDLARVELDVLEAVRAAERGHAHPVLITRVRPFERLAAGTDDVDPEFSAWLSEVARRCAATAARALDLALRTGADDPVRTRDLAQAAFNLDPTQQAAALALMQVHVRLGDPSGALRVYGALYLAHLQEHDEPPGGEVAALVARLKGGGAGMPAPAASLPAGGPARLPPCPSLRIEAGDLGTAPATRRMALDLIDRLGRRAGALRLTAGTGADAVLRVLPDGEVGLRLQLWAGADQSLLWSDTLAPGDGPAVAARVLAVLVPGAAEVAVPTGAPATAPRAETYALRLLTSTPDRPAQADAPAPGIAGTDPYAEVDRGWRALLAGLGRDAAAGFRRAGALGAAEPEVLGAAALGLALLGALDEAAILADRIASHRDDPGLRALRGVTLALCGDRRTAAACLTDLPPDWLLPCGFGAVMAELLGQRDAALARLARTLELMPGPPDVICDWALRVLPVPAAAEPAALRQAFNTLAAALSATTTSPPLQQNRTQDPSPDVTPITQESRWVR